MNQQLLIEKVAETNQITRVQAEKVLKTVLKEIRSSVKKGHDVKLVGFGTFTKAKRKARVGRNPQTGKTIQIPAAWVPKFRAGAQFKSEVRS